MKPLVRFFLFIILFTMSYTGIAQKETFGVVSYNLPKGWQQQQSEAGIQLSVTDKKTGGYALAMIAKPIPSTATANENFDSFWETLVKKSVNVNAAPQMAAPEEGNGWTILSGSANYTDGASTGLATLLTATANGQTVNIVLMTNTKQYQDDLVALLNSLELSPVSVNEAVTTNSNNAASGSVVGLWTYYTTEKSGYINGMPMLTAGYFRREYLFKANGTYIFRVKNWSVYMKEILFVYETGKWSVSGNTITLTPSRGVGEWWGKAASNKTTEWGKRVKSATWKLEPVSYTFQLKYFSGSKETALILKYSKQTERDGASNSNNDANEWAYSPRDKSIIDNPPGSAFDAGSEPVAATQAVNNSNNSLLAGKIFEGRTSEKFVGGTMNGFNTGGYFTWQYRFNANGTYRFVYAGASAYTDPNVLQYETGTYTINGNQLTIAPTGGANEEWSVAGGPVKLSAMSDVQIRKIKEQWGKRIKTGKRTLEKVTYDFKVEYMQGNNANALILQYPNGRTEREGNGTVAYYYETTAAKSIKLPVEIK